MKRDSKHLNTFKHNCRQCGREFRVIGYSDMDALKNYFALDGLCGKCRTKPPMAAESEDKLNE